MTRFWLEVKVAPALFRLFLMLAAVLLLHANRAQADTIAPFDGDMELSSGSGCDGIILTSTVFPGFSADASGGSCTDYHNGSGGGFGNVQFTTAFTHDDTFLCSGLDLFTDCGFSVDGRPLLPSGTRISFGTTLTILFFGLDGTHPGIPDGRDFIVNLNSPCGPGGPVCDHLSQTGSGGWFVDGTTTPSSFAGAANVPEPNMRMSLLLCGAATVLARALAVRRRQSSRSRMREIS